MPIQNLKETTNTSLEKENQIKALNLQDDLPLTELLKGVLLLCLYQNGKLGPLWFLDADFMWIDAEHLTDYLQIPKSIQEKKATFITHMATVSLGTLKALEKSGITNQHLYILSLLHKTKAEVENSSDLQDSLALLRFPVFKIESQPLISSITKSHIVTENVTKSQELSHAFKVNRAAERSIKQFLNALRVILSPEVIQVMVEEMGIRNPTKLLSTMREKGAMDLFKEAFNSHNISGETVYQRILAAIDGHLTWMQLVLASGVFDKIKVDERLLASLFDSDIEIGDLLAMANEKVDISPWLFEQGFDTNNISKILVGIRHFEKWWKENSKYFKEQDAIPKSSLRPASRKAIKKLRVHLKSRDRARQRMIKDAGGTITNSLNADIIICDSDRERRALEQEGVDKPVLPWDEFFEEYWGVT